MRAPLLKQRVPEGLHPWKGPTLEQLVNSGGVCEGLSPVEGTPMLEQGLLPKEEGTAETTSGELTAASFPSPHKLLGEWTEKTENEIEPRKSGEEDV